MTYYLLILLILSVILSINKSRKGINRCSFGTLACRNFALGAMRPIYWQQPNMRFQLREKALSFNPDGSKNSNNSALLTHDYITEYSYGITKV
jgi:hypothetical protein